MTEAKVRTQIVEACRRLYARNLLAASDGNVSFRLSDDRILFTPSGRQKGFIAEADIAVMQLGGDVVAGTPSAEQSMHLHIDYGNEVCRTNPKLCRYLTSSAGCG